MLTLFLLLILNIIVLHVSGKPLKNEICKNGIISFELAKDINTSTKIINSWKGSAKINVGINIGVDFLFLLIYSLFIALLIYNINDRLWIKKSFYKVGKLLIWLIFIAAFFDLIENIALVNLLLGDLKQIWSSTAYYFAILKFTIVFVCVFYYCCPIKPKFSKNHVSIPIKWLKICFFKK